MPLVRTFSFCNFLLENSIEVCILSTRCLFGIISAANLPLAPDGGPGPGVHCIIGLTHWQGLTQIHPTVQYYTQQRRESLKCMNILLLTPVPQPRLDRLPEIAHFLCALGYVYQNRNVYCSTILVPVNRLATAKPCVTV